ncbi:terminase small subunit [Skermanella mucosa]|uniref:terminase small subunit n=1 Tax=Skermanella mucosa TaxID=1789672 RepID=UPI00192C51CF|nr:terminase small subunit [Skermanella mucosa]UEM22043.1 terminase small subunit [Skermanella mucosa]
MQPAPGTSSTPVIRLTARQEAFCQAMAANVGGAEAARRAGYSPNGAKQRGAFLMTQPEIRIRVDQLRAARAGSHEADLEEAAETVKTIIAEAMDKRSLSLALRAVELRLKLRGVIRDKRIPHHYVSDAPHPDADLEQLDFDPAEDDDTPAAEMPSETPEEATSEAAAEAPAETVTPDSDPAPAPVTSPAGRPTSANPTQKPFRHRERGGSPGREGHRDRRAA